VVTLDTSHSYINTYTACDLICVITVHVVSIPAEIWLVAAQQLKQGLGLVPVGRLISSGTYTPIKSGR